MNLKLAHTVIMGTLLFCLTPSNLISSNPLLSSGHSLPLGPIPNNIAYPGYMSPPPTIPDDGILEIHLLQDLDSFFITLMQGVDNVSAEAVEYLERAKELKLLSYTCDENDDMFHTKTQAIPGVIGQLTKLEILNFAHNWISRLPEEIMSLQNLKWLNLSYNQLRTITPQLAEWLATIDTVPLTGNKITVAAPADNYFYF